ncbi:MAG: hypothetical protein WC613_01720 [Candidatus Aenigmatarchaeota archaeon]
MKTVLFGLIIASVLVISGCAQQTQYPVDVQNNPANNLPSQPPQQNTGSAKLCGDWPPPELSFIEKTNTMPSDFPSSTFLYPTSTLVGKTFNSQINSGTLNSQGEITEGILYKANLYFCADDSIGNVVSYYNNLPAIDGYQRFSIEATPDQSFFRSSVSEKNIKTAADYTWSDNVLIEGNTYSGKTIIHIIYAEYRNALP